MASLIFHALFQRPAYPCIAHPSPTCTSVPAGAKETPAHREPGASIIFRASCGITHETVQECPFLCGPGGEGSFKACFSEDVSRSKLAKDPEVCQQCLHPCEFQGHMPTSSICGCHPALCFDCSLTLKSATATPSSCTSVTAGETDTPAFKDPGNGLLYRFQCGISDETVSECPYLCSPRGEGPIKECFDLDFSGLGPKPVECTQCLPACKDK